MHIFLRLIGSTLCLAAVSGVVLADKHGGDDRNPPPTVQVSPTPSAAVLSAAGEGRRAYLKYNCYGCHGMGATGAMGPNIVDEADEVSEAVWEGKDGGMPSYRNIVTTTDLANLAAYLRSIGTPSEPKFNDWWVAVPPK